MEYLTHNEIETEALGARLAAALKPGAVVAYQGGLGMGKTAFTRGLASGLGYPKSRFLFSQDQVTLSPVPDNKEKRTVMSYQDFCGLGEDLQYFYLFRDRFGGYMIPKEALGEHADDFRDFIEEHTNRRFQSRTAPVIRMLRRIFKNR